MRICIQLKMKCLLIVVLIGITSGLDDSTIDLLGSLNNAANIDKIDNRIGTSDSDLTRTVKYATEEQFITLRRMVELQTQMLSKLVKGQRKLIKSRSRYRKWHKYTKRYLKKISKCCTCDNLHRSEHNTYTQHANVSGNAIEGDNHRSFSKLTMPVSKHHSLKDTESSTKGKGLKQERDSATSMKNEKFWLKNSEVPFQDDDYSRVRKGGYSVTGKGSSNNWTRFDTNQREKHPSLVFTDDTRIYNEESGDVLVDLDTGVIRGNHSDITWITHPTERLPLTCARKGLVRLNFNDPASNQSHTKLLIDMWFDTPQGWVFNVGDSRSNDGGSGDGTTQENDSEAQGYGTSFSVYASDKSRHPRRKILFHAENFITSRVTLVVSNEAIGWNNHVETTDVMRSHALFALNSQSDSQGPVNYNIYLSMNRVIGGKYRIGRGLCKLSLKWLN